MATRSVGIQISLSYPYPVSLNELNQLSAIWLFRITKASTLSRLADVSISLPIYKQMFSQEPRKGPMKVPPVLDYFIDSMSVTNIG